jgi:hypothetical protein
MAWDLNMLKVCGYVNCVRRRTATRGPGPEVASPGFVAERRRGAGRKNYIVATARTARQRPEQHRSGAERQARSEVAENGRGARGQPRRNAKRTACRHRSLWCTGACGLTAQTPDGSTLQSDKSIALQ